MTPQETVDKVVEAAKLLSLNAYPQRAERLVALLTRINKNYPRDSMKMLDALHFLSLTTEMPDPEEIDILDKLLPEFNASRQIKIRLQANAVVVTYDISPKKSGGHYKVAFSGEACLGFPVAVNAFVYADMDDLDNHGDCCPQRYDESSEEYSDDCNCENYVVRHAELVVEDNPGLEDAKSWIEDVFFGPSEDPDEAPIPAKDVVQN